MATQRLLDFIVSPSNPGATQGVAAAGPNQPSGGAATVNYYYSGDQIAALVLNTIGLAAGTTKLANGTTSQLVYDSGGTLGETSGVTFPSAGTIQLTSLNLGSDGVFSRPAANQLEFTVSSSNVLDYGVTTAGKWTFPGNIAILGNLLFGARPNFSFVTTLNYCDINNSGPVYFATFGAGNNATGNNGAACSYFFIGRDPGGTPVQQWFFVAETGVFGVGGATSSFPGFLSLGATMQCKLADNSGLATLQAKSYLDANGNTIATATAASTQKNITLASAPNTTTVFQMQGLAGSITPARTGNIFIMISGFCSSSVTTAARGFAGQISFGTGTAPVSNASLTGTQAGGQNAFEIGTTLTAATDLEAPIVWNAVVTGLNVGTTYWVDLAAKAIGAASVVALNQVSVSIVELP